MKSLHDVCATAVVGITLCLAAASTFVVVLGAAA